MMHLRKRGCSPCILIGGGGGRLDHLLGIAALFDRFTAPDLWLTHRDEVRLVTGHFKGRGRIGDLLSFFPAGREECRMHSRGLKWPLDGLCWHKGDAGISNLQTAEEFEIFMEQGRLIMLRPIPSSGCLP